MPNQTTTELPTRSDATVRRWPAHGEQCVIWHRGTHLWATWYDGAGLAGGPGAWIYTHNGSFVAFHDHVDRWWSLTDANSIRTPNRNALPPPVGSGDGSNQ